MFLIALIFVNITPATRRTSDVELGERQPLLASPTETSVAKTYPGGDKPPSILKRLWNGIRAPFQSKKKAGYTQLQSTEPKPKNLAEFTAFPEGDESRFQPASILKGRLKVIGSAKTLFKSSPVWSKKKDEKYAQTIKFKFFVQ